MSSVQELQALALKEGERRSVTRRQQAFLQQITELFLPPTPLPLAYVEGCGSARLRRGPGGYAIEVDPEFAQRYLGDGASALHLLCHELLHHIRGDLNLGFSLQAPQRTLFNLALDMFVDAHLEELWFDGEGAPYLQELYAFDRFPDLLLLPPRPLFRALKSPETVAYLSRQVEPVALDEIEWEEEAYYLRADMAEVLGRHLRGLGVSNSKPLARLYLGAWLDRPSFAPFWQEFVALMAPYLPQLGRRPLFFLGDHEGQPMALPLELTELLEALGDSAFGTGGALWLEEITLPPEPPDPGPILMAIQRALDSDLSNPIARRRLAPLRAVVGSLARSQVFSLALGHVPLFWEAQVEQDLDSYEQVKLYLDASGSMNREIAFLLKLVAALGEYVGSEVRVFSTEVRVHALSDIARGWVQTTGGTHFNCIAEDALAQGFRRILIITDGWGELSPGLHARVQERGLECHTVIVGGNPANLHPFKDLGQSWTWDSGVP